MKSLLSTECNFYLWVLVGDSQRCLSAMQLLKLVAKFSISKSVVPWSCWQARSSPVMQLVTISMLPSEERLLVVDEAPSDDDRLTMSGVASCSSIGSAAVSVWMQPSQVATSHGLKLSVACKNKVKIFHLSLIN